MSGEPRSSIALSFGRTSQLNVCELRRRSAGADWVQVLLRWSTHIEDLAAHLDEFGDSVAHVIFLSAHDWLWA
jgi:hypothetical protein